MGENEVDLDAAWRSYADRIKAVGERITGEGYPSDLRLRAEGYRYVSRLTNLAFQIYVEFGDGRGLRSFASETIRRRSGRQTPTTTTTAPCLTRPAPTGSLAT